jgi:diguanylate cyclase (GGDEF)-like protein
MDGGHGSEASAESADPSVRLGAGTRTSLLAGILTVAAIAGLGAIDLTAAPVVGWAIPFWGIAVLTFGSAFLVFHVEFRRESYTFTFSELVLVVGLFFASPLHLVAGRVLGEAVFLVGRERQRPRKLSLNLAAVFAETVVLLLVQQLLHDPLDVREPLSWLVALAAVGAAEIVGYAAIALAVRWHGGPLTFRSIIRIGLLTAPANTSLAIVVCVLIDAEPAAVPLLGSVAVFLVVMYRSYSSLRQRHESLSLLYDFTHLVSGAREPDEVLDAMLTQAKDLLRAERAEFWLALGDGTYRRHVVDDTRHTRQREVLPEALVGMQAQLNEARHAIILARDTPDGDARDVLAALAASDALVAPILEGQSLIGFVTVVNRLSEIYTFDSGDAKIFATLASHAGVALQNGRLIVRLHEQARQREHEALHDPLTALPNRTMFGDRLAAHLAAADTRSVAIALMDLDGFKEINDTLGHQAGDDVLIEIARRLTSTIGDDVLAARLGGDEFALIAPVGTDSETMETLCRRVRAAVAAPMQIDLLTVNMGVSIGIAIAPIDGDDGETLVRRADVAMYAAKGGHHGGVCFYDPARDENTPRRLALAHDLRNAIASGEISVVFQPKVAVSDGRLTGVECLSRWCHPVLGEVRPDEFIPVAERTGAIGELTAWMLGEALAHAARWRADGRTWNVAVNISVRNLLDATLAADLRRLLAEGGTDPASITLEITESHVMSDAVRATRVLEQLATLGVRLSIDDFGTGYSSLAYLQRLPVHEVKIDRSFVAALRRERGADAIVRSVLDLARNLDLSVVAEGVEDAETFDRLRVLGCDEAQGYFFAEPMPAADLERFADERVGPGGAGALAGTR